MRQAETRAVRNQAARSAVRTFVKNATVAVATTSEDVAEVVREAVRSLDRAAQKGIIHRNAAARRKSRLMSRLQSLSLTEKAEPAPKADKKPAAKASASTAKRTTTTSKATAAKKPVAKKPAPRKAAKVEK